MTPDTLAMLPRLLVAGLTGMGVTWVLTPLVRAVAVRGGWVSRPVDDRWGRRAIARLGGIAMYLGLAAAALLWVPRSPLLYAFLGGLTAVFGLGLIDDVRRIAPYTKLIAQLLIGSALVLSGIRIELFEAPWISVPLSVLWFVLVMNAFNLLDNMDGLSAGVGAIAALFCAVHAAMLQQWVVAALASVVCGVALGFLWYNFPPAKIYMGDAGSHLLGLSLAALALMGSWSHSTQLLSVLTVPALVLAVPIFDTCFVTLQRLAHRQHPFTGGTDHVSHRLAVLGLSTRQTVATLYGVSLCLGALSIVTVGLRPLTGAVVWLAVLALLLMFGRYLAQVNVYRLQAAPEDPSTSAVAARTGGTIIETMLLHKRRLAEILVDFLLVTGTYVLAHLLRFEGQLDAELQRLILQSLPIILVIKLGCFAGCGLYRGVWRYMGLADVLTICKAVALGSLLSALALLYLWRFDGYSRAVLIIDGLLLFVAVGGTRVAERLVDEWITAAAAPGTPVVVIGAGDTGELVLRYLRYESRPKRRVVGVLDDDVRKRGTRIHGAAIIGDRGRLVEVIEREGVQEVLVAISDPPGDLLQHVRACCAPRGVTWKVVTAGVMDTTIL